MAALSLSCRARRQELRRDAVERLMFLVINPRHGNRAAPSDRLPCYCRLKPPRNRFIDDPHLPPRPCGAIQMMCNASRIFDCVNASPLRSRGTKTLALARHYDRRCIPGLQILPMVSLFGIAVRLPPLPRAAAVALSAPAHPDTVRGGSDLIRHGLVCAQRHDFHAAR